VIETIHLQFLLATFAGGVGRQQTAVIIYLIEENHVLRDLPLQEATLSVPAQLGGSVGGGDERHHRFAPRPSGCLTPPKTL
jgi:hypothetical protein